MQATPTYPTSSLGRNLGYFLLPPLVTAVLLVLVGAGLLMGFETQYEGRIYPGVTAWGVPLGGLTPPEARAVLLDAVPYAGETIVTLVDPATGREWRYSPADLGLRLDVAATVDAALALGREEEGFAALRSRLESWYYGYPVAPVVIFDEAQVDAAIDAIAAEIDRPAVDATVDFDGQTVDLRNSRNGRILDRADTRARLLAPVAALQPVELELLIHDSTPAHIPAALAADEIERVIGAPINFYLQTPLANDDLTPVVLPVELLTNWLRTRSVPADDGATRLEAFIDEVALANWLADQAPFLHREPVNARFYFDDGTRELVLVEPHVNGRALDVPATIALFNDYIARGHRSVPFVFTDILPVGHSNVTAAELGITELVSESTTWFYGSSDERKHNIARSAANFYGILVAPGEEFSFNKYLGDVSEEEGYETGLVIVGGRTIEGVGGGVCQVSTTLFQSVFWAGLPINERWEHGYQVSYYNDGEGPGMDATVYSPIVDFRFTNNTPNYLLIENYYNTTWESLTFKIYSTDIGRVVEKIGPFFDNVRPPRPDVWEFNPELDFGEIRQVDWAVEGADVTVGRVVYNYLGETLIDESHTSNYIPWQNIYEYGPGVDPNDLPNNWWEQLDSN